VGRALNGNDLGPGIDQLPSRKYRARYRCDGCERHGGRPALHSESFDRLTPAKEWRAGQITAVAKHTHLDAVAGRIAFEAYAKTWLAARTFDESTRQAVELRLRLHAFPLIGRTPIRDVKPSTIQAWIKSLDGLAPTYRKVIFTNVSSVFVAAVDDGLRVSNPCTAASVKRPTAQPRKVVPWTRDRVRAVRDALPERVRIAATLAAGLGLRQAEVFGLSPGDVDFLRGKVEVQRQVKVFGNNRMIFSLPKGGKTRTVPLPESVRDALAAHLAAYPARDVTMPWRTQSGAPVAVPLVLVNREGNAMNRNYWNAHIWKPALTVAKVPTTRDNGMHALRHFYASALLSGGESIKAVADYLGHSDAGFTLRTYTHLMPESDARTRLAVDSMLAEQDSTSVVSRAAEHR
jgi:integrase